jgi:hypothetical protein
MGSLSRTSQFLVICRVIGNDQPKADAAAVFSQIQSNKK